MQQKNDININCTIYTCIHIVDLKFTESFKYLLYTLNDKFIHLNINVINSSYTCIEKLFDNTIF